MPGGSQGNLCAIGPIGRFNPAAGYPVQSSGAAGSLSIQLDLQNTPTPSAAVMVFVGETWNFQCWYRDFLQGQGATSNFTDAVELTFQ